MIKRNSDQGPKINVDTNDLNNNVFLRSILEHSGEAIAIIKIEDNSIININSVFESKSGWKREEVVGKPQTLIRFNTGWDDKEKLISFAFNGEKVSSVPVELRLKNGECQKYKADISFFKQAEEHYQIISFSANKAINISETRLLSLVKSIKDIIFVVSPEGKLSFISPSITSVLEYFPDELLGKNPFDFVHPEDMDFALSEFKKVQEIKNDGIPKEIKFRGKNGIYRTLEISGSVQIEEEKIVGYIFTARDVSERKQHNIRMHKLLNNLPEGIAVIQDGTIKLMNSTGREILGYEENDDATTQKLISLIHQETITYLLRSKKNHENGFKSLVSEVSFSKKNNQEIILEVSENIITFNDTPAILLAFKDITNKRNIQKQIFESQVQFKKFIENLAVPVIIINKNGAIEFINKKYSQQFGYNLLNIQNLEQWWGTAFSDETYMQQIRHKWENILEYAEKSGEDFGEPFEFELKCHDGELKEVDCRFKILGNQIIIILFDLSESRKLETDRKQSDRLFRSAFENGSTGMTLISREGKLLLINKTFADMLGYTVEDLLYKSIVEITSPDDEVLTNEVIRKLLSKEADSMLFEKRYIHKKGSIIWVKISTTLTREEDGTPLYFISNVIDISKEKEQEVSLKEKEERFRGLFEQSLDGLVMIDQSGKIIDWNKEMENIYGLTKEEVIGKDAWEIQFEVAPSEVKTKENLERIKATHKHLLSTKFADYKNRLIEQVIFNKKGEKKTILDDTFVVNLEKGFMVCSINRDITGIQHTKNELKESREKIKTAIFSMPVILFGLDAKGRFTYAEGKGLDLLDKDISELKGLNFSTLFNYEDKYKRCFDNAFAGITERLMAESNGMFFDVIITPQYNSKNQVAGIIGIASDITGNKKINDELHRLSTALKQSPTSIIITDIHGNIEYVNPKFTELTGYTSEDVLSQNTRILKSENTPPEVYFELWETILKGDIWQGEIQNKKKNGDLYWEMTSISSIRNSQDKIINFVAVKEDITHRKSLEFELQKSYERAEEASRLKSSLLANMNHEFRTPMSGILGFATILTGRLKDKNDQYFAELIFTSGNRLMNTLNSVVELSELESTTAISSKKTIDATKLIRDAVKKYSLTATKKGLRILTRFERDDIGVICEENLMQRVLDIHIDNAIKFTNSGDIRIELKYVENKSDGTCIFEISDTGIGIQKKDFDIIFKEFRQVSEGMGRSHEGTGLGLSISKKIIELHDGEILVESELGVGSRFIVKLPGSLIKTKSIQPDEIIEVISTTGSEDTNDIIRRYEMMPHILVVEDNRINQELMELYLAGKFKTDFAFNATDAIKLAEQKKYDAILMDINLSSSLDGVEVTHFLREIPGYERIPVIAVTGFVAAKDREHILSNGLDYFLAKPFSKEQILELLNNVLFR